MLQFQWSIFYILFNAPQNINEYHYIWGSDLREFGFARVRIKGIRISEGLLYLYALLPNPLLPITSPDLWSDQHWSHCYDDPCIKQIIESNC